MSELDLDQALRQLRAELSPASSDKTRLRAELGWAASAPAFAGQRAVPALSRWAALRSSGALGAGLALIVFGAGVLAGFGLRGVSAVPDATLASSHTPAPLHGAPPADALFAPAPAPEAVVAPEAAALNPAAAIEVPPERVRPVRPRATPAAQTGVRAAPLGGELALLRRVERALRGNDPALAVALLDELDARFPQTRLAEERLAARRMAECRRNDPAAALHAREFLREHPASVYSERVELACALETTAPGSSH